MQTHENVKLQDLISVDELAKAFNCSKSTVLTWTREKGLPYVRLGNKRFVLEQDLMKWIQSERMFSKSRT